MKDVTLNQKEQARLHVLNSVLEYQLPIAQAAELLGVSERHARRMLAAYREQGAAALAHGNRGRRPHNATSPAEAAAVVELAIQRYEGANHTHFTELLSEREGIDLSRPTVRRILTKAGIGSPRSRRSPQHRFRRQRMPQAGMLVQLDGSHHAWLEDRGPKCALLLAVDDATGAVDNAVFRASEDTRGYFMLLEGLIRASRDTPPTRQRIIVAPRLTRYLVPKELFSSAPFRCLARRQGRLRTQNPKSESKNQTPARSHAALQPHWNFKSGWRNAENTTRKETNGRSVYNPPATIKKDSANGEKNLASARFAPNR